MTDNKFFIGIISHKLSDKRSKQIERWRNSNVKNIEFYYFIGDPSIDSEFLIDEDQRIVYLKVPDNYESLTLKTSGILKFAHDKYGNTIKGVLKTDDDIDVDPEKIVMMLEKNSDLDYYGLEVNIVNGYESIYHWGKCESDYWNSTRVLVPSVRYCAGGGYYVKSELIPKIQQMSHIYESIVFEDVATGMIMNRLGILPVDINVKENGLVW